MTSISLYITILILFILIIFCSCIKLVPQNFAVIIERNGKYHKTHTAGVYFKLPFLDKITKTIDLREQEMNNTYTLLTMDQNAQTIHTEVYFQIVNPEIFAYTPAEPFIAITNMTKEFLAENIGLYIQTELPGKEISIAERIITSLNLDTLQWGIKITRIYLTLH